MSFSVNRIIFSAALFCLVAFVPASSVFAASFDDTQRKEIGEIIRDYLIKNPEVLQEVVAELEKKQQEETTKSQNAVLSESRNELYNSQHSSVVGNPNGNGVIIEFFDYNCAYCKRALSDITEMLKADQNLKLILKDLPVLGPDSVEAAQVGLAVKQQLSGAKLLEYHTTLMHSTGRVGRPQALALAEKMGLDMERLKKDMASPDVKAALQENFTLSDKLGLTGTPAFIIGDSVVPGAVGRKPLEQMVENTRKCGKAAC